jgi:hypothetical protein
MIDIAARRCGVEPADILSYRRAKFLVRERIAITRQLDARGYSSTRIGAILHRDHSTVLFYLGRGAKSPRTDRPGQPWRTPKIKHIRWLVPPMNTVPVSYAKPFQPRPYLIPYAGAHWPEYQWRVRP